MWPDWMIAVWEIGIHFRELGPVCWGRFLCVLWGGGVVWGCHMKRETRDC